MRFSKHNIISKIKDNDNYFIVNLLSQNADILTKEEYQAIMANSYSDKEQLIKKGYLVESQDEEKLYRDKYLEFIDDRERDEIQLFFVPTYACNFACSYCYQDEYGHHAKIADNTIVDAFFKYIVKEFDKRKKYITVFGGEPLLNSSKERVLIEYLVQQSKLHAIDLAFVTNGYFLKEYIPLLKEGRIREIQVTLDGTAKIHDSRRFLHGGGETFNKIVVGIDMALDAGIPINLRMVVDKENINELPQLARFAIEKDWTKNSLFKTQLGRNYELHHCQSHHNKLFTRLEMYSEIYSLIKKYPHILEFHKPGFSISKFLFEEGELPAPLFDSCPGTKTEWAFDYNGKIYACTATVGKAGEELGTYYPNIEKYEEIIEEWEERDVLSIEECKECNLSLACGGGCASVAKNRTGKVCSADCRPVKELMELGFSIYKE